jgi:hypothetical protein
MAITFYKEARGEALQHIENAQNRQGKSWRNLEKLGIPWKSHFLRFNEIRELSRAGASVLLDSGLLPAPSAAPISGRNLVGDKRA